MLPADAHPRADQTRRRQMRQAEEELTTTNGYGKGHPIARRLGAGLVGALSLTGIHEAGRRLHSDAPRMDIVAERALVRLFRTIGLRPPRGKRLYAAALAGDLLSNAGFYTALLAGATRRPWTRSILGGTLAGVGALALPRMLGLARRRRVRYAATQAMTVGLYVLGGLAAAAVFRAFRPREEEVTAAPVV
jgi:hypothetical protein